jgi:hypothetical protein
MSAPLAWVEAPGAEEAAAAARACDHCGGVALGGGDALLWRVFGE